MTRFFTVVVVGLCGDRYIPSSYRPSCASVVQVAWQAYMSSVSYDAPHRATKTLDAPEAPLLVRGGQGNNRDLASAPASGLRSAGERAASVAVAPNRRRATGRYAYTPTSRDGGKPER